MGCFMNILWLMFGGIITAVEYLIASLLMMFTIIVRGVKRNAIN